MKEVKGYKAFNNDATNRCGKPFTEGETYRVDGEIRFGNEGNGFHMCTFLSDVFRYVNAIDEEVLVARHPKQLLKVKLKHDLPVNTFIRKK